MVYPAQSPETVPAPKPSCWFIFAGMWLFVYNYVSADSWVGFAEKINKKDYFLTRRWSIEIVPKILLPPCRRNQVFSSRSVQSNDGSGSGSGRPKNIGIRIHNTGLWSAMWAIEDRYPGSNWFIYWNSNLDTMYPSRRRLILTYRTSL